MLELSKPKQVAHFRSLHVYNRQEDYPRKCEPSDSARWWSRLWVASEERIARGDSVRADQTRYRDMNCCCSRACTSAHTDYLVLRTQSKVLKHQLCGNVCVPVT